MQRKRLVIHVHSLRVEVEVIPADLDEGGFEVERSEGLLQAASRATKASGRAR